MGGWWDFQEEVKKQLNRIEWKLDALRRQEKVMAIDLTKLTAEVAANTTVTGSVVTLINNLAAQIKAIPPSDDPVTQQALDALVSTLNQNDTTIAAKVTENTPAA